MADTKCKRLPGSASAGITEAQRNLEAAEQEFDAARNETLGLVRTALDPMVFGFALAAVLGTAVLFGIIPALQISRGALGAAERSTPGAK